MVHTGNLKGVALRNMSWFAIVLCSFLYSCSPLRQVQHIEPDPLLGGKFLLVPAGTQIGDYKVQQDGCYLSKGLMLDVIKMIEPPVKYF